MKKLYLKFQEQILYVIFGLLTTAVNFLVYTLFTRLVGTEVMYATIIAWIISVVFAFVTNKLYVFKSIKKDKNTILKEIGSFFAARILSVILELVIMYVFVEIMHYNDMLIKIIANIIVIVVNYVLSKFWVFKKQKGEGDDK